MRCDVARQALSARIDGEAEGVVPAEVDDHLEQCPACCAWHIHADRQASALRAIGAEPTPDLSRSVTRALRQGSTPSGRVRDRVVAGGLAACGVAQIGVALAQMAGFDFGMAGHGHDHGAMMSEHVMNETTAWGLALGVCMLAGAFWRRARAGLLVVLSVFAVVLGAYVIHDAIESGVTVERVVSHLPVFLGLLFAIASVRSPVRRTPDRSRATATDSGARPTLVHHDSAA
ncbi:MAG: zf-HC2 domain-containing protein [Gordonia sp. (in: high G+C Gram-positive bacteria)]|uniref:zf-HC2 domain-containing protein n=1 Tax=Gordonia sp. (in: high G+C Gram-positive bacteria) TaxID=84139 RepID=UPI0039E6B832